MDQVDQLRERTRQKRDELTATLGIKRAPDLSRAVESSARTLQVTPPRPMPPRVMEN